MQLPLTVNPLSGADVDQYLDSYTVYIKKKAILENAISSVHKIWRAVKE